MSNTLHNPIRRAALLAVALALIVVPGFAWAAKQKPVVVDMRDFVRRWPASPYSSSTPQAALVELTVTRKLFFTDLDGDNSGWSVINFRQGQPNAWHTVTGAHACVGTSWWCGQTGFLNGDGYDNNWVQLLTTNVPINLAGTTKNDLTFKHELQCESAIDWAWVLIKGGNAGARWDTLWSFSGDLGGSCNPATISIPDSFTTVVQPVQLGFLFGSDLSISAADAVGAYTGWSIDDVKITGQGNVVSFFDDMEGGTSNWVASTPTTGPLWHIEDGPGTSTTQSCYFLSTHVWVPFQGSHFGLVPDFADAMLVTPPVDLKGIFSPNTPTSKLVLAFDDWVNLPFDNALFWSLWISGSDDLTTWTPWRNAFGDIRTAGGNPQCTEGFLPYPSGQDFVEPVPYFTIQTGVPPGTRYIRFGFRIRDEKATFQDGGPLKIGVNTEGIYFDNIGVYYSYTISGVEMVSGAPIGARTSVRNVFPNPFNPRTTIEFSVPTAGPVAVRIFDIHGKEVTTVANSTMNAGVYRAHWDGKDRGGADAASGVYFAQIQSRTGRDSARLMLLK